MPARPIIVLGAGATKACGGPLTDEILPAVLNGYVANNSQATPIADREQLLNLTRAFLTDFCNVPTDGRLVKKEDCPSLPMLFSMLRRSVELGKPLGNWEGKRLIQAKRAIEYSVFSVIEAALLSIPSEKQFHYKMLKPLYEGGIEPAVVSLNYDVIVDNALFSLNEQYKGIYPPNYSVEIATEQYKNYAALGMFGQILKIHGSLNWLYCERCKRLDLFVSEGMRTGKALDDLYHSVPVNDAYSCRGTPCRNSPHCNGFVSPILITPTYVKDYENPHINRVWTEAECAMKASDRAVIIGYSLPSDDVEVAMLLKRGLDHLPRNRITIVEYVDGDVNKSVQNRTLPENHPTGQRFRWLFGAGLDWHTTGFEGWLNEQEQAQKFPFGLN